MVAENPAVIGWVTLAWVDDTIRAIPVLAVGRDSIVFLEYSERTGEPCYLAARTGKVAKRCFENKMANVVLIKPSVIWSGIL